MKENQKNGRRMDGRETEEKSSNARDSSLQRKDSLL